MPKEDEVERWELDFTTQRDVSRRFGPRFFGKFSTMKRVPAGTHGLCRRDWRG